MGKVQREITHGILLIPIKGCHSFVYLFFRKKIIIFLKIFRIFRQAIVILNYEKKQILWLLIGSTISMIFEISEIF